MLLQQWKMYLTLVKGRYFFSFTLGTNKGEHSIFYVSKQTLTSKKRGEKKSQTSERCKIVKSETPSGVTDFTILHLSRR